MFLLNQMFAVKKFQLEKATLYTINVLGFYRGQLQIFKVKLKELIMTTYHFKSTVKISSKILIKLSIFYMILNVQFVRFTHIKEKHRYKIFIWLVVDSHNSVRRYSIEYYSTNMSQPYLFHLIPNLHNLGS